MRLIVFISLLLLTLSSCPNGLGSHLRERRASEAASASRGITLCTGRKMIDDARAVILQIRHIFHSKLPIAVIHCDELDDNAHNQFSDFSDIRVVNLCKGNGLFGMGHEDTQRRLHSWFCKTAALILSPFNETIVSDLDVVWFKQPDKLFDSPAYRRTGTTFFRDRLTFNRKKQSINDKILQDVIEEYIQHESAISLEDTTTSGSSSTSSNAVNITAELGSLKVHEAGVSFFWRNVADREAPTLDNFQDSSVLVLDRERHPRLLRVLGRILPSFNLGYGDKEIYWVAAIISGEPYSFEPFLTGLYGDCGLLLHYDPNEEVVDPANATPFYMNGEWILEKAHSVGQDLEFEMLNPVLALPNTTLFDLHSSRGCSCGYWGCRPVSGHVNRLMTRAIWERLTRRIDHTLLDVTTSGEDQLLERCVQIFLPALQLVNEAVGDIHREGLCGRVGCPHLPVNVSAAVLSSRETLCVPLSFDPRGAPSVYASLTLRAHQPLTMPEGLLLKGGGRSVYLVRNGTLHEFPNGDTFLAMGFEWGAIQSISNEKLAMMAMGEPIPPIR